MKFSLNNLSIKAKLFGNACILLILLGITAGYAIYAMGQIGEELDAIADQDMPLKEIITKITEHQLEQGINFERAMRFGELLQREKSAAAHYKKSVAHFDELGKQIEQELKEGEALAEDAIFT